MIILDIEGTSLPLAKAAPQEEQPRIAEIAALKLDTETLGLVDTFSTFVHPGIEVPREFTKITGITDEMLEGAPSFARIYPDLAKFFTGTDTLVAHNLPYDRGVLAFELARIDRSHRFPWPMNHICTVELTEHFEGKPLKQEYLFEAITRTEANQSHRAFDDALQLLEIVRWLRDPDPVDGWDVEIGEAML